MKIRVLAVAAVAMPLLAACGDGGAGGSASIEGFSRSEDTELAELVVESIDADAASSVYDELGDIEGWLGSLNTAGSTTLRFVPYPDAIDAAIANKARVEAALGRLGPVEARPFRVVIATFAAAPGSPLLEDPSTASDSFDDLGGCDWEGSALNEEHLWYCEGGIDESVASRVREGFAGQAGIEPQDVELIEYR